MSDANMQLSSSKNEPNNDRQKELEAFDESKAGVKGLVDAGIVKIPSIFVLPTSEFSSVKADSDAVCNLEVPVINLKDARQDVIRRKEIIKAIQQASEEWGLFQVVDHGMSSDVMSEMIEGVRRFHEHSKEVKMEYYTRDDSKKVRFVSNYDLYQAKAANWRDTVYFLMEPDAPSPEEIPEACREIVMKYSAEVKTLGLNLFELLSEALGLEPNHLIDIDCAKGHFIGCHYYPACPEPHLTLGISAHTDPAFITILLQDHIGGLQVRYENQWVDVPPIPGAFVVNLGDLLQSAQLISNNKFKSAEHRVLAKCIGPRISLACFFSTRFSRLDRLYGPLKELLSDENPPLYREVLVRDYVAHYNSKGIDDDIPALDLFRLQGRK
ncbi:hypothetical protein K2173_007003 [Erythroxylum novogranatense]|uniref:Fe2OG dioxygenase domain-containing protein n=1 Tax=Erythroxylum novogranatense TaxID=1862640 RepID=A0AAV8SZM9_9ROSI|nr:hypothetical protein K2173_007003 [Erythroxylum novogranatense]